MRRFHTDLIEEEEKRNSGIMEVCVCVHWVVISTNAEENWGIVSRTTTVTDEDDENAKKKIPFCFNYFDILDECLSVCVCVCENPLT